MSSKDKSTERSKTKKSNLKGSLLILKSFFPLFLSHHPECNHFSGHTLKVGKVRLCIGCFVGYPSAIFGIFLISVLDLKRFITLQAYLNIGIVFLFLFFLSFTGLTKIKLVKVIQKFLIGIGSSFLFWGIWYQPLSFLERYNIFFTVFGFILSVLNMYHVYGFYTNCNNCDIPFGWYTCEGFKSIRLKFEKYNLGNIFKALENYSKKIIQKRNRRK